MAAKFFKTLFSANVLRLREKACYFALHGHTEWAGLGCNDSTFSLYFSHAMKPRTSSVMQRCYRDLLFLSAFSFSTYLYFCLSLQFPLLFYIFLAYTYITSAIVYIFWCFLTLGKEVYHFIRFFSFNILFLYTSFPYAS
jgi:hypothetical protein